MHRDKLANPLNDDNVFQRLYGTWHLILVANDDTHCTNMVRIKYVPSKNPVYLWYISPISIIFLEYEWYIPGMYHK